MIYNSLPFVLFFTVFFFLYWLVFNRSVKGQNAFLLAGSYFFYAWWDWRFLFLLIGTTLINYWIGLAIGNPAASERKKKWLLYAGVGEGIALLFVFKYLNFFVGSFSTFLASFNFPISLTTLNLILPLGISFYTFRTMSYVLDIHKGKMKPTRDVIAFSAYVAFFPTLISGPIDKARDFIPQLQRKREFTFERGADGLRQILWGLFKKMVVADNCAVFVNQIFDNYTNLPASTLVLGAFLYAVQLYADFSGYSDIAIGIGRLLGFDVARNFAYPYFANNIAEFWRRWHMSLTSWVTEYVFTPLTIYFRDYGKAGLIVSILINMVIVGIWHGANWTFVAFGVLHGLYFIPLFLSGAFFKKQKKAAAQRMLPTIGDLRGMVLTFFLVMMTSIVFRANTMGDAFRYFRRMISASIVSMPVVSSRQALLMAFGWLGLMFIVEWFQRTEPHALQVQKLRSPVVRTVVYYAVIGLIIWFGSSGANQFLYFKF